MIRMVELTVLSQSRLHEIFENEKYEEMFSQSEQYDIYSDDSRSKFIFIDKFYDKAYLLNIGDYDYEDVEDIEILFDDSIASLFNR